MQTAIHARRCGQLF